MQESKIITSHPTRELLIASEPPKKTNSYSPVPHRDVINLTLELLDKANLKVSNELYSAARDGRQAMGFYNIHTDLDKEMEIRLIWHNSYDKSMPLRWAIGGNVMVCTNGIVRGDLGSFKRKHTGTILTEFKEEAGMYINQAGELFKTLIRDKERMKEIPVTKREAAEMVGRMHILEDVLTATQVGIIKKELEKPTFDYKADGTLWQFYNHNTVAMKEQHPQYHLDSHQKLHKFITKEYEREFA